MRPVIKVENLGKKYVIGHRPAGSYTALRDVIAGGVRAAGHRLLHPFAASDAAPCREDFWALDDISFDVNPGDRVGVIGRNGAGKSTLLKILSRITEPTRGRVSLDGRVASLLEVGTGFHPELTGRENIYLNGAILGMSRLEIRRKFDEIVAFAEVEQFLDTPVKHYSSGMYVRLAFAVAAHLEPEILVVDEVLAVGDAQFQKKCLGKMSEVSTGEGRTVLFVSHNLTAVQNLCDRALYLEKGRAAAFGPAHAVVERYVADFVSFTSLVWEGTPQNGAELGIVRIEAIPPRAGSDELYICDELRLEVRVAAVRPLTDIAFEIFVETVAGVAVFSTFTPTMDIAAGETVAACTVPAHTLNDGHYTITVGVSKNYSYFLEKVPDALTISMLAPPEGIGWQGEWAGIVRPKVAWDVRQHA